jgi:hypothetical protein
MAPRDPILGVTEKFLADTAANKMNLGVVRARPPTLPAPQLASPRRGQSGAASGISAPLAAPAAPHCARPAACKPPPCRRLVPPPFLAPAPLIPTPKGAYRDDDGKPVVLECVREAERRVMGKNFME